MVPYFVLASAGRTTKTFPFTQAVNSCPRIERGKSTGKELTFPLWAKLKAST
uniref:Uncharacterized protein n=1 Tax=Vibrio sp. 1F_97 TaxID=1652827 RepID=A0A0H3ZS98_9VIBR|nr:hypothetical protein [Vibrio sp. 1F_97]